MIPFPPLHDDAEDSTTRYDAEVARYSDAPDECTISPAAVDGDALLTTWLSAQEGSYVDLAEMR